MTKPIRQFHRKNGTTNPNTSSDQIDLPLYTPQTTKPPTHRVPKAATSRLSQV